MTLVEKYNTLVGLVKALRAYSWTPATTPDDGRDHPLYPSNNRHNRFPLWQAINELLVEEKDCLEIGQIFLPNNEFLWPEEVENENFKAHPEEYLPVFAFPRSSEIKESEKPPFTCIFCGAPSWYEPADQAPPADYCHESDHGEPC